MDPIIRGTFTGAVAGFLAVAGGWASDPDPTVAGQKRSIKQVEEEEEALKLATMGAVLTLRDEFDKLRTEIAELRTLVGAILEEVELMPGGRAMKLAEQHFEVCRN